MGVKGTPEFLSILFAFINSFLYLYFCFNLLSSWESAPVNSVGPGDHEKDNNMALSQVQVLLEINTQPTSVPDKEAELT